jgi:hypothetical protein
MEFTVNHELPMQGRPPCLWRAHNSGRNEMKNPASQLMIRRSDGELSFSMKHPSTMLPG